MISVRLLLLVCLLNEEWISVSSFWFGSKPPPPICTDDGCVQGKMEKGNKRCYDAWYGIPYAAPPIGPLRFEDPLPPYPYKSTYDATYQRSPCMQADPMTEKIMGNEDCLHLNVYRPRNRNGPLPVLVYLDGGSFKQGSSDPTMYGPEFLMDTKEVVVVIPQFRLNVFGFLAANHISCKGNFGLKDQNLALKWVRNNIHHFGGDGGRVTLVGHSSGAASVQYQMMSKRSNGLFQRAVFMSGSALAVWTLRRKPETLFREYAVLAGITNGQSERPEEIVRLLKGRSAEELMRYHEQFFIPIYAKTIFRPVVEQTWNGSFITEAPSVIWASGRYEQRPFVTGVNGFDTSILLELFYNETRKDEWIRNWKNLTESILDYPPSVIDRLGEFYFNGRPTRENSHNVFRYRDRLFNFPLYRTVEQYTGYGDLNKNPVDVYLFNFTSSFSTASLSGPYDVMQRGASHNDELLYLFSFNSLGSRFVRGAAENQMKDHFVQFIVDYAKNGSRLPTRPCRHEDFQDGFCEYLNIQRNFSITPNQVSLSVSRAFDLEMVRFISNLERVLGQEGDQSNFIGGNN